MQLIEMVFCIEERSVLGNKPQIFYVTVSFALYTPTSWLLAWELHRKDKKRGNVLHFDRNCQASYRAETTKCQQQQWGL